MCFNSAIEGFKIWKTYSTEDRMHLLTQVITILEDNRLV